MASHDDFEIVERRLVINEANRKAFLTMIAVSEGTKGIGDDGYNVEVGGSVFGDYSCHPHPRVYIKSIDKYSTAAGRYQLLFKYFEVYRKMLDLDSCKGGAFGKEAQDIIAIQQIRERHALNDVDEGNFDEAVAKCSSIWASLPGGCQRRLCNTIGSLRASYVSAGGTVLNILGEN